MSRRALLLVAAVSLLWGIPYLFIAVAVDEVSPAWVAFARTGLAALVLLPLAAYAGVLRPLRDRAGWLVVLAVTQMAGPFLLLGFAEERIPSSLTSILVAATPLLLAVLALGLDPSQSASGLAWPGWSSASAESRCSSASTSVSPAARASARSRPSGRRSATRSRRSS